GMRRRRGGGARGGGDRGGRAAVGRSDLYLPGRRTARHGHHDADDRSHGEGGRGGHADAPVAAPAATRADDLLPAIRAIQPGYGRREGVMELVLDGHATASFWRARLAMPRWTWVLTEPREMPRAAAVSSSLSSSR